MAAIDERFGGQFEEFRMLSDEQRAGFAALQAEIGSEVDGVRAEIASVHSDFGASHRHVTLTVAGFAVGVHGLLGAWLALAVD